MRLQKRFKHVDAILQSVDVYGPMRIVFTTRQASSSSSSPAFPLHRSKGIQHPTALRSIRGALPSSRPNPLAPCFTFTFTFRFCPIPWAVQNYLASCHPDISYKGYIIGEGNLRALVQPTGSRMPKGNGVIDPWAKEKRRVLPCPAQLPRRGHRAPLLTPHPFAPDHCSVYDGVPAYRLLVCIYRCPGLLAQRLLKGQEPSGCPARQAMGEGPTVALRSTPVAAGLEAAVCGSDSPVGGGVGSTPSDLLPAPCRLQSSVVSSIIMLIAGFFIYRRVLRKVNARRAAAAAAAAAAEGGPEVESVVVLDRVPTTPRLGGSAISPLPTPSYGPDGPDSRSVSSITVPVAAPPIQLPASILPQPQQTPRPLYATSTFSVTSPAPSLAESSSMVVIQQLGVGGTISGVGLPPAPRPLTGESREGSGRLSHVPSTARLLSPGPPSAASKVRRPPQSARVDRHHADMPPPSTAMRLVREGSASGGIRPSTAGGSDGVPAAAGGLRTPSRSLSRMLSMESGRESPARPRQILPL